MKLKSPVTILVCSLLVFGAFSAPKPDNPRLPNGWRVHDMNRPVPKVVQPGKTAADAPSDAIVLFDGTDLSEWKGIKKTNANIHNPDGKARWKVENGYMEVTPTGGISTKRSFGDMQLHIEWASPTDIDEDAQRRGNSGVFLMGRYEIQIMDGYDNDAYADGMTAAVYGQYPALVNVNRKPGEWQSYDILFKAPVFDGEQLVSPAYVTILHNGVLVQNNVEILGPMKHNGRSAYKAHADKLPIGLQYHGQPVRFRNIWVREL